MTRLLSLLIAVALLATPVAAKALPNTTNNALEYEFDDHNRDALWQKFHANDPAIPILDMEAICQRVGKRSSATPKQVQGCIGLVGLEYEAAAKVWDRVPIIKRKACLVYAKEQSESDLGPTLYYASLDNCLRGIAK